MLSAVCGCSSSARSPSDVIAPGYLDYLEAETIKVHEALFIVNKFFAHASTPRSRELAKDRPISSLNQFIDTTVWCGRLVNSVSAILSQGPYPFLANALWDKWEWWGKGWNADTRSLEETWQEWGNKVERLDPLYPDSLPTDTTDMF